MMEKANTFTEASAAGIMTAEQAIEAGKGLTFEIVWTALMESRVRLEELAEFQRESHRESQKRMDEAYEKSQKRMDEAYEKMQKQWDRADKRFERIEKQSEKTDEQIKKTYEQMKKTDEQIKKTQKQIDKLSENVGGVNNSIGLVSESLFAEGLGVMFNKHGYTFTKQGPHVQFKDKSNGKVLAEVDYLLEDGKYAMAVEVKTKPKEKDIDRHMERIAIVRNYFDERGDNRVLVGAVAGGIFQENVMNYALEQGLYAVKPKGESLVIADLPEDFKVREW